MGIRDGIDTAVVGVTGRFPYKIEETVLKADEARRRSPRFETPVAVASIEPTTLFAALIKSPTTLSWTSRAVTPGIAFMPLLTGVGAASGNGTTRSVEVTTTTEGVLAAALEASFRIPAAAFLIASRKSADVGEKALSCRFSSSVDGLEHSCQFLPLRKETLCSHYREAKRLSGDISSSQSTVAILVVHEYLESFSERNERQNRKSDQKSDGKQWTSQSPRERHC